MTPKAARTGSLHPFCGRWFLALVATRTVSAGVLLATLAVTTAVLGARPAAAAQPSSPPPNAPPAAALERLESQVEVLTAEVRRLREEMALPATDAELASSFGMGPAASKVYQQTSGLSIGGYGEFFFEAPLEDTAVTGAVNSTDLLRLIMYLGYKFSSSVVMNTEIEFEHATTEGNFAGKDGEVSVEFAYLDFLLDRRLNLRAGSLLVPMGLINRTHEPPFFRGVSRPDVERRLIPTTWRENGVGLHGELATGLRYDLYALNGLNGAKFDEKGFRDGRQNGNRALWEDVAGVVALDYDSGRGILVGGSFYLGESDQNRAFDGRSIDATTLIGEAHAQLRHRGLTLRALAAFTSLDEDAAAAMTLERFPDGTSTKLVPSGQWGAYVEAAYDVARHLGLPATVSVSPWARYESYDLQSDVPQLAGRQADPALAVQVLTLGLEVKPVPQVVLKADYTLLDNDAGAATSNPLRVGAGFVF